MAIEFIICFNRNGKIRLNKWFNKTSVSEQRKIINMILKRINSNKFNFNESSNGMNYDNMILVDKKLIFKKYNNLIFLICIEESLNELVYLHSIPLFVEILNIHFANVSELDLIFNFYKLDRILDQIFINGELITTNKDLILSNLKLVE